MSEIGLKPCPFCGKNAVVLTRQKGENGWRDWYYVLCDYDFGGCGASGGWRHYAQEAVDVWNTRTGESDE